MEFVSPIHKATRQISLAVEGDMRELGLGPGEGHLLCYLRVYGPSSINEIRRVFGHKRSTLTSMLDRLDGRSLIRRKINRSDRRVIDVEVTPQGKDVAERVGKLMDALEAAIYERVLPEDLDGFRNVMAAIAAVTQVELRPRKHGDSEASVESASESEKGQD